MPLLKNQLPYFVSSYASYLLLSFVIVKGTPPVTPTPSPPNCVDQWIGDQYCDDVNNNLGCNFDGGDCCYQSIPNWDNYCDTCECLIPITLTTTNKPAPPCQNQWIGDQFCDDVNNNLGCNFDGGDCCDNTANNWNIYCGVCQCLDPSATSTTTTTTTITTTTTTSPQPHQDSISGIH